MDKKRIESNIGLAYDCLEKNKEIFKKHEIIEDNKKVVVAGISSVYRGYISTFGASVTTGNLLSAIAFFSKDGDGDGKRSELIKVIFEILKGNKKKENVEIAEKNLFEYVRKRCQNASNIHRMKEEILDYAIAVKLAMNLFTIVENKSGKKKNTEETK